MGNAYTPSFSLLGTESLIMEQSEIGEISTTWSRDCLRCGKCKPVCSTTCRAPTCSTAAQQDPRHLAAGRGLPVRAQTRRGISLMHFCRVQRRRRPLHGLPPLRQALPGRYRLRRRLGRHAQLPAQAGKKRFSPARRRRWPSSPGRPGHDQADARVMMAFGLQGPRLAHKAVAKAVGLIQDSATCRRRSAQPSVKTQIIHFINKPMPGQPAQAHLARCSTSRTTRSSRSSAIPQKVDRRLRPMPSSTSPAAVRAPVLAGRPATQAMLYHVGAKPCCRPATCAAAIRRRRRRRRQGPEDHHRQPRALPPRRQYAELSRHQDGDRLCGTCMDQLQKYQFERSSRAAACSTSTNT